VEADILGTDFTYDDLRAWTPRFVTAAESVTEGDELVVLAGRWLYRQRTRVTATGRIGRRHGLPLEVTWCAAGSTEPFRTLCAHGIEAIDGVSMPAVLSVCRPAEGYSSRMELRAARIGQLVGSHLFEPAALPAAHDALQELSASL
jgi:hypothetical protein